MRICKFAAIWCSPMCSAIMLKGVIQKLVKVCTKVFIEDSWRIQRDFWRDFYMKTKKLLNLNSYAKFYKDQSIRVINYVKYSKWKFLDF